MVEHSTVNRKGVGSSPTLSALLGYTYEIVDPIKGTTTVGFYTLARLYPWAIKGLSSGLTTIAYGNITLNVRPANYDAWAYNKSL